MFSLDYLRAVLSRLATNKSGAVATEYAFLIAFIAIVAALGMVLLGENLSAFFNDRLVDHICFCNEPRQKGAVTDDVDHPGCAL